MSALTFERNRHIGDPVGAAVAELTTLQRQSVPTSVDSLMVDCSILESHAAMPATLFSFSHPVL